MNPIRRFFFNPLYSVQRKGCIEALKKAADSATKMRRLAIGFLSNGGGFTTPKAIEKIQKKTNTTISRIDFSIPWDIDHMAFNLEVQQGLNYINSISWQEKYISRPDAFLEMVESGEIAAPITLGIIHRIRDQAKSLDCIFLPGGEDVPRKWFGEKERFDSYYRSILEFTLAKEARKRGIPLMGVCRGLQVTYVYYGAKLEQFVPNQWGEQLIKLLPGEKHRLLGDILSKGVNGTVMHSQGVSASEGKRERCELVPLAEFDGLVKAAESKDGAPLILTQFHPEMFEKRSGYNNLTKFEKKLIKWFESKEFKITKTQLKNNDKIFDLLHDCTKTRNWKRQMITDEALQKAKDSLRKTNH